MWNIRPILILPAFLLLPYSVYAQDLSHPSAHFEIEEPAELNQQEAEDIYQRLLSGMASGYSESDIPEAAAYLQWQRFNSSPYISQGHGNRFLNNYGNKISKDYLAMEDSFAMPPGSILAKDSFTVTKDGGAFPGALFLMEKMPGGTRPEHGDWRYVMIMPDGSLLGDSLGENPSSMDFCHECHEIVADTDYLYGIPEENHVNSGE